MNTPNKITLIRLLMIPLIIFFYLATFIPYGRLVAAILFMIACFTDFLDGYIARKTNQVTTLGKFFDTIVDKILIMSGLLLIIAVPVTGEPVVGVEWLGVTCAIVILAREFIVSALRQIAASKGKVLAADMGGKIKATIQFIIISIYMVFAFVETEFLSVVNTTAVVAVRFVLMVILIGTAIFTVYTGAGYLIRNRDVFKEEKTSENEEKSEEKVEEE